MNYLNIYIGRLIFECWFMRRKVCVCIQKGAKIFIIFGFYSTSHHKLEHAKELYSTDIFCRNAHRNNIFKMKNISNVSFHLNATIWEWENREDLTKLTLKLIKFSHWKYDYDLWHDCSVVYTPKHQFISCSTEQDFFSPERKCSILKVPHLNSMECFISRLMLKRKIVPSYTENCFSIIILATIFLHCFQKWFDVDESEFPFRMQLLTSITHLMNLSYSIKWEEHPSIGNNNFSI